MKFEPGEIAIVRKGARDVPAQHWGENVEVIDGPVVMCWWASTVDTRIPPDFTGPAYWAKTSIRIGWVLEESLEKRKPPREPTVAWEDIPYFNPTKELLTCP